MTPHYLTTKRPTLLLFFAAILLCIPGYAQISGVVYRDFDGSGTRTLVDPIEMGANGVKVRAYVGSSSTPLLTTTNEQGEFAYTAAQVPAGSQVKLEFYDLGKMNYSGPFGAESGTSLQFLQAPTSQISFGIFTPPNFVTRARRSSSLPALSTATPSATAPRVIRPLWLVFLTRPPA